jgi:hypothetical protein
MAHRPRSLWNSDLPSLSSSTSSPSKTKSGSFSSELPRLDLDTLLAYLAPEGTKKFRQMPEADKLVLARILKERKR